MKYGLFYDIIIGGISGSISGFTGRGHYILSPGTRRLQTRFRG